MEDCIIILQNLIRCLRNGWYQNPGDSNSSLSQLNLSYVERAFTGLLQDDSSISSEGMKSLWEVEKTFKQRFDLLPKHK